MYTACLFCHAGLGDNDSIEGAPHGRRFVFDRQRGRLWIVCRGCHRWNLTPFEDRWDVIEECERLFRSTRVRLSTDNVGLARMPDGTDLVRVGEPLRPEFAAWRYGRELLSRRPVRVLQGAGAAGLIVTAPYLLGSVLWPVSPLLIAGGVAIAAWKTTRRTALRIPLPDGVELRLSDSQIRTAQLLPEPDSPEGWALVLDHLGDTYPYRGRLELRRRRRDGMAVLTGLDARIAAGYLLPRLNLAGGDRLDVAEAVRWLETVRTSDNAFAQFAGSSRVRPSLDTNKSTVATFHTGVRLALEMAVHEEEEQRLLRGELSMLELGWRREERLAAIADGLTVPDEVEQQLAALRGAREPA